MQGEPRTRVRASFADGITAESFATLPMDPGLWRDVEYWLETYDCSDACVSLGSDNWSLGVASVTRTVGGAASVPEPGSLALLLAGLGGAVAMRRRPARPRSS